VIKPVDRVFCTMNLTGMSEVAARHGLHTVHCQKIQVLLA